MKRHILIIDDEAGTLAITSKLLERLGYTVTAVADAQTALTMLQTRKPDLIVTDYMMPGMDGIDFIKAVRAQPAFAQIPILLRSVHLDNPAEIAEARAAGATDVFAISQLSTLGSSSFNRLLNKVQSLLKQPA
jgi:CheY-like chemotaxis protein